MLCMSQFYKRDLWCWHIYCPHVGKTKKCLFCNVDIIIFSTLFPSNCLHLIEFWEQIYKKNFVAHIWGWKSLSYVWRHQFINVEFRSIKISERWQKMSILFFGPQVQGLFCKSKATLFYRSLIILCEHFDHINRVMKSKY